MARGIETWARDTAAGLASRGVDVTLFAGAPVEGPSRGNVRVVALPGLRRTDWRARRLASTLPRCMWRWGLTSGYGWEQLAFWGKLVGRLRRERFDVLHVQDPMLADWCRRSRRLGLLGTKEILAHGTEEPVAFLAPFPRVQHLAPWHLAQSLERLRAAGRGERPLWTCIPNFVDCSRFSPVTDADSQAVAATREWLGVPRDAFVVGCVAAVKKHHKRIDYLVREFSAWLGAPAEERKGPVFLVVAGSRQDDTAQIEQLAKDLAGDRVRVLCDVPVDRMPALYRALDVFVLTSLFEMMPIAVLEALASGVPVIANQHPVLEWMIGCTAAEAPDGAGGMCIDMAGEGELERCLGALTPEWLGARGRAGRKRAERTYSEPVVLARILEYYEMVMSAS